MKRFVRRALSNHYKQLDDFKTLCHLRQKESDYAYKDHLLKISPDVLFGDDMMSHQSKHNKQSLLDKLVDKPSCIVTYNDSKSRNNICSTSNHDTYTVININDLAIGVVNQNTQLIAKIIKSPSEKSVNSKHEKMSEPQSLFMQLHIEDNNGDQVALYIYNYCRFEELIEQQEILSSELMIGTQIIIKNPYLKKTIDGNIGIRIDNPFNNLIIKNDNTDCKMYINNININININTNNDDSINNDIDHKLQSYYENKNAPMMLYDSMKIAYIDDCKGRGIIATKDIDANVVVLKEPALCFGNSRNNINKENNSVTDIFSIDISHDAIYYYNSSLHNLRYELLKILNFGDDYDRYLLSLMYYIGMENKCMNSSYYIPDIDIFDFSNENNRNLAKKIVCEYDINRTIDQVTSIIDRNAFQVDIGIDKKYENYNVIAIFVLSGLINHSNNCNLQREYVWIDDKYPVCIWKTNSKIIKGHELSFDYGYDEVHRYRHW